MKKNILAIVAVLMLAGSLAVVADPPPQAPPGFCTAFCNSIADFESLGDCIGTCAPLFNPGSGSVPTGLCKALIEALELPHQLRGDCIAILHGGNK